jgi:hypothetical protein
MNNFNFPSTLLLRTLISLLNHQYLNIISRPVFRIKMITLCVGKSSSVLILRNFKQMYSLENPAEGTLFLCYSLAVRYV